MTSVINLNAIDYRAFLAEMDSCMVRTLLANSVVESVSLNSQFILDQLLPGNTTDTDTARDFDIEASHRGRPGKRTVRERNIPPASQGLYNTLQLAEGLQPPNYLAGSPRNLDWLTAPWAQRGLAGQGRYCRSNFASPK